MTRASLDSKAAVIVDWLSLADQILRIAATVYRKRCLQATT